MLLNLYARQYGEILENQLHWATEQNFMIVQWSVDTVDWKGVKMLIRLQIMC